MFMSVLAARELAGGTCPAWYLPVSSPWARGDQTICEMPWAAAEGEDLRLGGPPEHGVLRLGGHEDPGAGDVDRGLDLLRRPFTETEAARLAVGHDLLERLDGLLDRDVGVEAVGLVEIDVVGTQAGQRGVDLLADLRGRQAPVGRVVRHLAPDLGGQHVGAAGAAGQDLAPRGLRRAPAVDVGRVEEVDAGLERRIGAGPDLLQTHAAGEGQPRAQGNLGDLQVRRAELAVFHAFLPGGPVVNVRRRLHARRLPHSP